MTALLTIRGALALTGYPQLGGHGLHIAHMLWGGLLMLIGLIVLTGFWNARAFGAFVGGLGFGTFIDELGKFITADNDYFYQPTIALIYAIFVALFVSIRIFYTRLPLSDRELRVDAQLRAALADAAASGGADLYERLRKRLARAYERIARHPLYRTAVSLLFIAAAVSRILTITGLELFGTRPGGDIVTVIRAVASLVSAGFVVLGAVRLRHDRLVAYQWFRRSVVVSMLGVQFFILLESELAALGGLAVDLVLYAALGYALQHEQSHSKAGG